MKIKSISTSDPLYPSRLGVILKPPDPLYVLGDLPAYKLGVAIVGTRKPTHYGQRVTTDLAGRLAEKGACIISGLAHGIDGVAHRAALNAGGTAVAVLASGLDQISPRAHQQFADEILSRGGAIVSEQSPGTPPLQFRFLHRNRLVSGLSDIVIVTEAGISSGTMNTVSHALEQGKDVYAVPGPITSAMSAGCNALIAQGATPIVSVDLLIEQLFPRTTRKQATLLAQNENEQSILELLALGVTDGEELHSQSKLSPADYSQTITMLEIRGAVRSLGANRWGL
jgi:DNA processing protein